MNTKFPQHLPQHSTSNQPNRQTFREVAGKHAIEKPHQALLHKITSIFDHVCKDAIYARTFATFQALDALGGGHVQVWRARGAIDRRSRFAGTE
ncbi:TPA: hypothetical protein ACH3X1_005100 [Trebouxia sp. C0004]